MEVFRYLALGASLVVCPVQVLAETAQESQCVVAAAQSVPVSSGTILGDGIAKEAAVPVLVARAVGAYPDVRLAATDLNRKFNSGLLTGRLDTAIRRSVERGSPGEAETELVEELNRFVLGGATVFIKAKIVGRDAVFAFVCLWNRTGGLVVVPTK